MAKWDGQPLPESMTKELRLAFIKPNAKGLGQPRLFKATASRALSCSDLMPRLADCADDICMIRSMFTDQFNHHPGQLMLSCGTRSWDGPSMGSWVSYGLGKRIQEASWVCGSRFGCGSRRWQRQLVERVLPPLIRAFHFGTGRSCPLSLQSLRHQYRDPATTLDASAISIEDHFEDSGDLEIASRIASYELAFRMQSAAPELLDFSKESEATLEMYGENELTRPYATNCLLAREWWSAACGLSS